MPYAAPRPCSRHPRILLSRGDKCPHCEDVKRQQDRKRGSAASRGYDSRWQKARKLFLMEHPLCECEDCQAGKKRTTAATVVDHIIPHKGDMKLFWDKSNWQAMAKTCHDRKTALHDGAWGKNSNQTDRR